MSVDISVTGNLFRVAGVNVFCGAIGSGAEVPDNCVSVWEKIPDGPGINAGMVEAAKRRWPDLPSQDQDVLLRWPPAELRVVRRSVLALMHDRPTLALLDRAIGDGPRVNLVVEEAKGGYIIHITLFNTGWSTTP